jgi:hypothetical protein
MAPLEGTGPVDPATIVQLVRRSVISVRSVSSEMIYACPTAYRTVWYTYSYEYWYRSAVPVLASYTNPENRFISVKQERSSIRQGQLIF